MPNDTPELVHLTREFTASPIAVFDAWVEPDIMRQWLFVGDTSETRQIFVDARPGGAFSILEIEGDDEVDYSGNYLEIKRPHRVAFTLQAPGHFPRTTRVVVEVSRTGMGSAMRFTQEHVERELVEGSWRAMFDRLDAVLRGSVASRTMR